MSSKFWPFMNRNETIIDDSAWFKVVLNSLHKYKPKISIIDVMLKKKIYETSFAETEFIAVTAYQNEEVCIEISKKCRLVPMSAIIHLLGYCIKNQIQSICEGISRYWK